MANRFDGCSATTVEGRPPWRGIWIHPKTRKSIIDRHMLIVLYAAQNDDALTFCQHLKTILEEAGNQKVVVIENMPVDLLEGKQLASPEPSAH